MILLAYFLILFNLIILTNTIEVTPETFQDTLSKAKPGDIIELSSGTYNKAPYKISTNGKSGQPIIIKPVDEAKIIFQGSNNDVCIFELINNSYIYLEGKMEMINAYCGIKILDSNGNILTEIGGHVEALQPGATYKLKAESSIDISNAYDFIIE